MTKIHGVKVVAPQSEGAHCVPDVYCVCYHWRTEANSSLHCLHSPLPHALLAPSWCCCYCIGLWLFVSSLIVAHYVLFAMKQPNCIFLTIQMLFRLSFFNNRSYDKIILGSHSLKGIPRKYYLNSKTLTLLNLK